MLKKRIVGCLPIKDGVVVQSIAFQRYLPVGRVTIAAEFLGRWGIDEIVVLDLDATPRGRGPDVDQVTEISKRIFVPLTTGGGIRSVDDARCLIHSGADKISINTAVFKNPKLISDIANVFGNQCVVVAVDVRQSSDGTYTVWSEGARHQTGLDPVAWANRAEMLGAGEIFLTSVDRDGTKRGYDEILIRRVVSTVHIPVVASGGAGQPSHFFSVLRAGASAAAAGNMFHFTEHSPVLVKSYLRKHSIDVRIDSPFSYAHLRLDRDGRLIKSSDRYLDRLRFQIIREEVI